MVCPAKNTNSDLFIIGHSFLRRLHEYVWRSTETCGVDLGLSAQLDNVFYYCVGGLTFDICDKYFHWFMS